MQVAALYPQGEQHRLRDGELACEFGAEQGFRVVCDNVAQLTDGRRISHFIAQKL